MSVLAPKKFFPLAAASSRMPEILGKEVHSSSFDNRKPDKSSLTLGPALSVTTKQRASEYKKLTVQENRRPTSPSRSPFEKMRPLKPEQNEVALLAITNYKTRFRVGIKSHETTRVKCLIDTRPVSNLVSKSFLHPTGTLRDKRQNFLMLGSANKQTISSKEKILYQFQVGELRILVWLGVTDSLVTNLLLKASFTHKYIQNIFQTNRKLSSRHSPLVDIIVSSRKTFKLYGRFWSNQ